MRTIHLEDITCAPDETVFSGGGVSYLAHPQFLRFPEGCEKAVVSSVCCDEEDNIYALTRNSPLSFFVFSPKGELLHAAEAPWFRATHGLFYDNGELLATDSADHFCCRMSPEGELLQTYGTPGHPSDTGYDPDVIDRLINQGAIPERGKLSRHIIYQYRLDTVTRSAGPFNRPTKLIRAKNGNLFCSDGYANAAVHCFDPEGNLLMSWGRPGRNPGEFRAVHGVWEDRKGRIWVADRENGRVQVFTALGELLFILEDMYRPTDFWENANSLYICESDGALTIFDLENDRVRARLGGRGSRLCCHGISGTSKGDLLIACLLLNTKDRFIKLERIS